MGRAGQSATGQGRAGQGRAGQGKAQQGVAGQGRAGHSCWKVVLLVTLSAGVQVRAQSRAHWQGRAVWNGPDPLHSGRCKPKDRAA